MKILAIILLLCTTALAVSPSLTSFNGGQVSPLMESRTDFPKYLSSCRTMENMLVTVQGPVERRPGTKYIAAQGSSSAVGRIIGFDRSANESYILLFEDQSLSFFTEGGQVLGGTGTEDISGLNNIVAHWLCNEITGTAAADDDGGTHDGAIVDSTDTATDASLVSTTGKVGDGCFDLDGTYTVAVTDHSDFSFTDDSDDAAFSMACWAYITDEGGTRVLLSKWRDTVTTSEWRFSIDNNKKLQLHLADTSASLSGDRVAQWKLNEDAANTTILDDSANNHDGTTQVDNTEDVTATGKISKCIDFGGAESIIITSDADTLSFGDSSNDSDFSIAAWIFVTTNPTQQTIFSKWESVGNAREYSFHLDTTGKLSLVLSDEDTNKNPSTTTDDALESGWHFVVCTYDGDGLGSAAASRITLYVDNVAVDTTATNKNTYVSMVNTTTKAVVGGRNPATPAFFFEDKIDNVVLFDKTLTQADISSLYNSGEGTEGMGSAQVTSVADDAIDLGWHLLCVTYSAPADESTAADGIIFYVDGTAVSSTATNNASYTAMQNGAEEVRIGSQRNAGDTASENFWADKIDEISVYSDVLTPTEIASLYINATYEIVTPYLTADLSGLNVTKNDDVMYIAHPDYEPKQLSRVAPSLWTLEDIDFQTGPFLFENDTATTISSDGTTGSVTLTASTGIFKQTTGESHVGSIWQINQVGGNPAVTGTFSGNGVSLATNEFTGGYSFTTTDSSWVGTITLQRSTNDGVSWRPALTPLTDTNFDNPGETEESGAIYRVVASSYTSGTLTYNLTVHDEANRGVVEITGVSSSTSATATVISSLVSTSATTQWREGFWSDYRGWPKTVTFHQQRLVFGGSTSYPQTVWFGKQDPDEYENFLEGTLDTSAFTVELEGQNPIRWLLSQDYMLIGTSGTIGKWGEQGLAVTPTSPNYQEQTRHGSAAIQAGLGGDAVLYIERGSRKVRQFSFDLQVDKYLSPDLTILSPEITESGIDEIAFQLRPDPILWCVLDDGDMATLTYQQDQSIAAWTKQVTDGNFKSVAVISGQDGTSEDEVWVIVERDINSTTVFYIEQFQPQEWGSDDNDAWFVDCGITYDDTPTDTFTGADHLEAETVSIYADLLIESPETVGAGAWPTGGFTIDNAASRVLVGMPYTSKLETLPLVISPQDKAANKKVKTVWFDVYKTGAFQYGNGANSTLTNFNFENNLDRDNTVTAQDLDVDPATSIVKPLGCRWVYGSMKKQTVYMESNEPMPLTVRSITPDYKFYNN